MQPLCSLQNLAGEPNTIKVPEALLGELLEVCLRQQRSGPGGKPLLPLTPKLDLDSGPAEDPGGHAVTSEEMPEGQGA